MADNYFYGNQSEQFSFYRVPKLLFTDPRFRNISVEAKVLYGIMLDRMSLSQKNGWFDDDGRVYIVFTIEEIAELFNCGSQKAVKLLTELERDAGLLERKRRGLGRPNLLYIKNFAADPDPLLRNDDYHDSETLNDDFQNSFLAENAIQECPDSQGNYTDKNKTDMSDTDSYPIESIKANGVSEKESADAKGCDANRNEIAIRKTYREFLRANTELDLLIREHPLCADLLREILDLMVDVVTSTSPSIRVSGEDKPADIVRSQFLKLNGQHILYVLDCLEKNTTEIRNIRQYMIAALYNAPMTIGNYYRSLVNHDMYGE